MNKGVVIISAVVAMFGSVALADKAVSDMIISEAEYELCQVHRENTIAGPIHLWYT